MYREKTLLKFNEDKSYKFFPGVTIISMLEEGVRKSVARIKVEMVNSELFDKFIFLPEQSYHMTVCDLVTYNDMTTNSLYTNFPLKNESSYQAIDQAIMKMLGSDEFDLNVRMKVKKITKKNLTLEPHSAHDAQILQSFRSEACERLGIKNRTDYVFHVSLSYQLQELDGQEQDRIDDFLAELNDKYLPTLESITVKKAELSIFDDMSNYRRLAHGRRIG